LKKINKIFNKLSTIQKQAVFFKLLESKNQIIYCKA
jgi:hypothetical protein